jgi:hypothetical protein
MTSVRRTSSAVSVTEAQLAALGHDRPFGCEVAVFFVDTDRASYAHAADLYAAAFRNVGIEVELRHYPVEPPRDLNGRGSCITLSLRCTGMSKGPRKLPSCFTNGAATPRRV